MASSLDSHTTVPSISLFSLGAYALYKSPIETCIAYKDGNASSIIIAIHLLQRKAPNFDVIGR